jgi:hypothetical protein
LLKKGSDIESSGSFHLGQLSSSENKVKWLGLAENVDQILERHSTEPKDYYARWHNGQETIEVVSEELHSSAETKMLTVLRCQFQQKIIALHRTWCLRSQDDLRREAIGRYCAMRRVEVQSTKGARAVFQFSRPKKGRSSRSH